MTLHFNLRNKLIAYSLGIAGLTSSALITYDVVVEGNETRKHAAETSVAVAQAVSANLVDPIYTLSVDQVRRQLQAVRAVPDIMLAQALDHAGAVLVDSEERFAFQSAKPPPPELLGAAREKNGAAVRVTDDAVEVVHPVLTADGEIIGYAYLKSSLTHLFEEQADDVRRTAALAGMLLVFASLLAYFFARSFSAPVGQIVRALQAVRDGDLETRVSLRRNDELGTVAENLNDMVAGLKAMTLAIQREKQAAEAANHAKSRFLANMSHEIRTPMNGVIGMTELLLEADLADERQHGYALTIRHSAESLLGIINDVLDFSKIEANKLDLEHVEIGLRDIAAEVLELLEARAESKGLVVWATVDDAVAPRVRGDPHRLRQMLVNLVGNAIKFTEHGEVQIRIHMAAGSAEPRMVRFEVVDTGIGIAAAKMSQLFQPFEQGDASTTKRHGGTGLGLAITKQLAERMGGRIGADSETGRGSTFWFEVQLPPAGGSSLPPPGQPRRVALLIGDQALDHHVVERHLALLGVRCIATSGMAEATARLRAAPELGRLDLVIMDVGTSKADVVGRLRALRALPPCCDTPAVLATAEARLPAEVEGGRLGRVFELRKPARLSDLRRLVRSVLDGYGYRGRVTGGATSASSREFAGTRILLAEDNEVNRLYAEAMLKSTGCELVAARDGNEALAQFQASRFDLLLLDWQMPGMDGLELLGRIRAIETTRTPAIVITANAMQNDREQCLAAGFDDYLAKPFRKAELLKTVRACLRGTPPGQANDTARRADPTSAPSPENAIDVAKIEELHATLGADEATTARVIRVFLDDVPTMLETLSHARGMRDAAAAAHVAHTLKSSGAYVGAARLTAAARRIDAAFKAGDIRALWPEVDRLCAEIEHAREALRTHLARRAAPPGATNRG